MENLNFSGRYSDKRASIDVVVGLLRFEEEGRTIVYSPAFDLSGYGNNPDEASDSFKIAIDEFFKYTLNKKSLTAELKRLGWNVKESNIKRIKAPDLASLINSNEYLAEILNEKQFTKFDQTVTMPC